MQMLILSYLRATFQFCVKLISIYCVDQNATHGGNQLNKQQNYSRFKHLNTHFSWAFSGWLKWTLSFHRKPRTTTRAPVTKGFSHTHTCTALSVLDIRSLPLALMFSRLFCYFIWVSHFWKSEYSKKMGSEFRKSKTITLKYKEWFLISLQN